MTAKTFLDEQIMDGQGRRAIPTGISIVQHGGAAHLAVFLGQQNLDAGVFAETVGAQSVLGQDHAARRFFQYRKLADDPQDFG